MVLLKRRMCQIVPWVMMSQADPNGSSILVLWAERDTSHFFFVCQMSSVFLRCITPPCPLSLSQTLQWSITSNTAICHECLMSHRDRKLFDHMIRHSIKNLVLRRTDWVHWQERQGYVLQTFWLKQFALFYCLHISKHFLALLSSAILSSSFFYHFFFLS